MIHDWNFVWTPQFLVGTVIAGLLLNIVGAYMVRALDHVRKALPASFRRVRQEMRKNTTTENAPQATIV